MIKLRGFSEAKTIATVEAPVTVTSSLNAAIINNGNNSFEIIIDRNRASLLTRPNVWLIGSSTANAAGSSSEETSLRGLLKAHVENTLFGTFNYLALHGYWSNKFLPYGSPLADYHRNIDATLTMDNVFTDDTPRGDQIVIISLPSNDIDYNTNEQFITNLRTIFNRCKERGVHCFITQTQPRDNYNDQQKLDLRLCALLIQTAFPDNFVRIFDDLTDNVATIKPQYAAGDQIHLNDSGHALIFSRILSRWDTYFIDRDINHYKIERSLTSNFSSYTVLLDNIDPAQLRHTFQRPSEDLWYYRIRAVAANGTSIVSNTISLQQAEFVGEILRTVNINLTGSAFPLEVVGTSEWNDFVTQGFDVGADHFAAGPLDTFLNLLDNTGGATGIGIAILGSFEVAASNGDSTGNFMPDPVARAYISSVRGGSVDDVGDKGAFRISGLNPTLPHNIYVYSDRNSSGLTRYVGAYCEGRYGAVLSSHNIDTLIPLEGILAPLGFVDVYISGLVFGFGYVNAVILEERDSVFKISFAPEDIIIEETGFLINPIPDGADTLKVNITGSAVSGEAGWVDLNIQRDIEYDVPNSIGGASGLKLYFYDIAANAIDNGAGYGGTDTWPAAVQRYTRSRTLGFDLELRDVLANEAINFRFLCSKLNSTLTTRITINGNASTVAVNNNHSNEIVFEGIRGDAAGTILVEVDNVLGQGSCYITAIIIKRVAQQSVGVDVVFVPEDIVIEETSFIVDVAPLITFDAEDITVEETSFEVTSGDTPVDVIFDAEDIIVEETGFNLGISFSPEDIIVEETSFEVSASTPIVPFSFTTGHFYKPGYEGALYISRYDAAKQTKVILALSGSGVATITAAINQGSADYIGDGDRPELPDYNVMIFILCNNADNLWGGPTQDHIFRGYKYIRDNYTVSHNIDWDFCAITGLSLGGAGVLNAVYKNRYSYVEADDLTEFGPRNLLWSAGFIVCGSASSGISSGVDVNFHYEGINHMAIWTLHGTTDTTQNYNNTPKIINGINAQNPVNPPKSTWFWATGHNIYGNHTYNRFNKTNSSFVRIGSGTAATASKFDWFEWITKYSRDPVKNATSLVTWAERGSNWTHPYMDYLEAIRAVNNLSAGATKTALLARLATVKAQFSRVWILDYGQLAGVSAGNINNITNQNTGQTVLNLITDDGSASIVGLNIPSRTGTDVDGVALSSHVNGEHWGLPKTFMKDGAQVITTLSNGSNKFTGLNGSKKYEVLLFHLSSNTNNTAKADIHVTAVQAIGDIVKTQYSEFNTSTFIYFGRGILGINNDVNESLTPIGGELTFNIRCNTGSFTSRNTNVVGIILIELP